MKKGVIFFHKNIQEIYEERWIEKCIKTILSQTVRDFSLYEINYGGGEYSIFEGIQLQNPHLFISENLENHAEAMNRILDIAFEDGCEYVFNTNLDDFYHPQRFEIQIKQLQSGFDLVSSDFCYIEEIEGQDVVTYNQNIKQHGEIKENLEKDHNIIAHPCVAYSRKFWGNNRYVPEEIPMEDMLLWKRAVNGGFRLYICDEVLLNYRLHENQVTGKNSYLAQQKGKERGKKPSSSSVNFISPTLIR
jgi:hypothetical protein